MRFRITGTAIGVAAIDVGVLWRSNVTVWASWAVVSNRSPSYIFSTSHWFEMLNLNAGSITAQMVKLQPFWDRTNLCLIGVAMSQDSMAISTEFPVAIWLPCALPSNTWNFHSGDH